MPKCSEGGGRAASLVCLGVYCVHSSRVSVDVRDDDDDGACVLLEAKEQMENF